MWTQESEQGMDGAGFDDRLARERRARLAAERLLVQKQAELFAANERLAEQAESLSDQVIEQREENAELVGQTTRARADLEVATEKAERAERRLWDSLDIIEDGFAIYDRDGRLVAANTSFLAVFEGMVEVGPGASYESILRIAADEGLVNLQGAHPDDWVDDMIARWEETPVPPRTVKLWNGGYVKLVDKRAPDGDMVSLMLDITETIRRERDLLEARDQAEAANRAKSAFLANMSHEIRTPMNGVVAMADLLRETDLTEDQRLYADTVKNSGEALLEIINDVLDYSKIEADKLVLHSESFDLEDQIREIFRLLRPSIQGRDVQLLLDYDIFLPDTLVGDRGRIRQVLTNLIGNAVKFTEAGHVLVRVLGEDQGEGRVTLVVAVEDTGIGIAPDKQAHIFGEFNQVEDQANRKYEGTGLGLAITRRLIGMMGGEMWLESELGQGSTFAFRLTLPVAEGDLSRPVPPLPKGLSRVGLLGPDAIRLRMVERQLYKLKAEVQVAPTVAGLTQPTDLIIVVGSESEAPRSVPGCPVILCDGAPPTAYGPPRVSLETNLRGFRQDIIDGAECPAVVPPNPPGARPPAPRKLRLLAAEDNKTNQMIFRKMLKDLDLSLTLVSDGAEALAAYRAERPDLLFTDISMPGMDGLDLTRQIRRFEASEGGPRLPIVAMTAHAMEDHEAEIYAAGVDYYLTKPLRKAEILARIEALAPEGLMPVPPRQSLQEVSVSASL